MKRLTPSQKLRTARALIEVARQAQNASPKSGELSPERLMKLARGLIALARYQQHAAMRQADYAIRRARTLS